MSQLAKVWKYLRNKCSSIRWIGWKEEMRINSEKLQKTASGSWSRTMNLISSTLFFIIFLAQYSTSNVFAWSWLLPLQNANCIKVERNWFWQIERFLQIVFMFAITRRRRNFFLVTRCVKKQDMHYQSADNPTWQITKSLHSEWITGIPILQYRIIRPKTDTLC